MVAARCERGLFMKDPSNRGSRGCGMLRRGVVNPGKRGRGGLQLMRSRSASIEERYGDRGKTEWEEAVVAVTEAVGWEREAAEVAISRAFAWEKGRGPPYWKKDERDMDIPNAAMVRETLNYLESETSDVEIMKKILSDFPEVLGCDKGLVISNVDVLKEKWKMKGKTLVKTLGRKPKVLGLVIDCEGVCAGDCGRCWAQF